MKRKFVSFVLILLALSLVHVMPASAAGDWIEIEDKKPVEDYAYSFVVVGDTQILTYSDATKGTNYLSQVYDWIVANKEEKKIEYVFGLGDITDQDWLVTGVLEWQIAKENIYKLNGVVPYSMIRGNHDSETYFKWAFDIPEYKNQFVQFYKENLSNSYRTINICGDDYLMVNLDHGPLNDELDWASRVIEKYPDHRVILTTHWYLAGDGSPGDEADYGAAKPVIKNHGTEIWNKLIKNHDNIFMVMSGHYGTDDIVVRQRISPAGNKVTQVLVDPQSYDAEYSESGMIGIFYFSEDGKYIDVEYFSPIKNKYFREKNQFRISIPRDFQKGYETPTVATTEAVTTVAATTTDEKASSCKGTVTSAFVVSTATVTFTAFAVSRKKKRM